VTSGATVQRPGCEADVLAVPETKARERARAIALREAIAPTRRATMAEALAQADLPFLSGGARTVSAFYPVGAELDIMVLVRRLLAEGHRIALPVVRGRGRQLIFRDWRPGDKLEPSVRGIPAPAASAPELVPDVLLVPLLQFDHRGYRLGYGGGFYDRTIHALRAERDITAVGVGFAAQRVEAVPTAPHDARLDWILTEDGPLRISAG